MRNKKTEITVNDSDLVSIHAKLEKFMAGLPEPEREAMSVILARAATAREETSDTLDEYLSASDNAAIVPTLPMLARALDGVSEFASDVDGTKGLWAYKIWTYKHK